MPGGGGDGSGYVIKQGRTSGSVSKSPRKNPVQTLLRVTMSKFRQNMKAGSKQSLITKLTNIGGGGDKTLLYHS